VVLLLILLVSLGWLHTNPVLHLDNTDQAILNQDIYWAKGPFVFLVDKDFPRNESFTIIQKDRQLSISTKDITEWLKPKEWKYIYVVISPDFSFSCDYFISNDKGYVHELELCHRNNGLYEVLTDLNADGIFDMRYTRDDEQHVKIYVCYHGVWREINGGEDSNQDKFHKQLLDGTRISFDIKSGQWLSPTDKPVADNDNAAHEKKQEKRVP
jgi:hypothetical protein